MIGETVSHYRITAKLGEGGMGVVYRARDTQLDRDVALKFLPANALADDQMRARFVREAKAAAGLNHPNIATVYGIGETDAGQAYIAMELVEGETLAERVARGLLGVDEVVAIGGQMAAGLQAAHEKDVVHRDIKSANVMLDAAGRVRVMDFGLATTPTSPRLTQDSSTLGTLPYMSPEQAKGAPLDRRTDIWSLGVVLYEMIAGRLPFAGDYAQAAVYSILNEQPDALTAIRTGVPMDLERVVMKCLEKEPERRYQHAAEIGVDLRAIGPASRTDRAERSAGPRSSARFTTWKLVGGAVVVLAALIALGVALVRGNSDSPGPGIARASSPTIAVLPLRNMSREPDQDVFADGMTEELINTLARIEGLSPLSRRSVGRFAESEQSLAEIARELGADYVIEGAVLESEGVVRITVSLFEAGEDTPLWGNRYERPHRNVLALQSDVAMAIARQIEVVLTPGDGGRLAAASEVDPRAHRLYVESRSAFGGPTADIDRLQRALEIDPDFAAAWGALAESYVIAHIRGLIPPEEAFPKARAAAERALELDPTAAEARTALGEVVFHYDWEWDAAIRQFQRALDARPGYATALWRHAAHLAALGRPEESIATAERAFELEPSSVVLMVDIYLQTGSYDRVIALIRGQRERGRRGWHLRLSEAYVATGRTEAAPAELDQAEGLSGNNRLKRAWAYAAAGEGQKAKAIVEESATELPYLSPYYLAAVYTALGDVDRALEYLEEAYQTRDANMIWVKIEDAFEPLYGDPRFEDILRRMRFPES